MKPYLIAEIGINHNGDLQLAIEMINAANLAGADAVKFQKRDIESCYTVDQLNAPCKSPWGKTVEDKVLGRELSWEDFAVISDHCAVIGIDWGCSCFDLKSLSELEERFGFDIAFHKVPSAMALHQPFLDQVQSYRRRTIISTGLIGSCKEVLDISRDFCSHKVEHIIFVTTALYPCPPERCKVVRIAELELYRQTEGIKGYCKAIGWSGHEVGVLPSVVAVFQGAQWVERHFTTDRSLYGSDQSASLEPKGLAQVRRDIDLIDTIRGMVPIDMESADRPSIPDNWTLVGDEKNPVPNLLVNGEWYEAK